MAITNSIDDQPNKFYIISVSILTFVLPTIGFISEHFITETALTYGLFSKWFIFSAVGLRLFLAGIKQVKNPEFTAKQIFHLDSPDSFPILRPSPIRGTLQVSVGRHCTNRKFDQKLKAF